jgi:hypothetical protein
LGEEPGPPEDGGPLGLGAVTDLLHCAQTTHTTNAATRMATRDRDAAGRAGINIKT